MKSSVSSGVKLIVLSIVCALLPYIIEILNDGGLSHYGDPETGYAKAAAAFFFWPIGIILFIIGVKRIIYSDDGGEKSPAIAPKTSNDTPKLNSWNIRESDKHSKF